MNNYTETIHSDVLIFGAGPAGISAAISAAKEGQKVILVELQNKIGGTMTSCPGMMLGGGYPCGESIGGFFESFVNRMIHYKPSVAERRICGLENFGDELVYDHEYAISILYEMLQEAGVTLLINQIAHNVIVENNTIKGVEVINTRGLNLHTAGIYIDCTGNGDIATKAGVSGILGDERGLMMGVSLTFFMENVSWERVFNENNQDDPYFSKFAQKGIQEQKIHASIPQIYMLKGFRKGSVFFNTVTVTGIDGTDSNSILSGTITARKRVLELAQFCIEEIPGFEDSFICNIGPIVGIRETRKLEGLYQLTIDDIAQGKKFIDGIVVCDNPIDEVFRDEETTHYSHDAAIKKGDFYSIPFRALVPKEIKNLLFAGRNISTDKVAFASVRGMPQCMIMGQSVGIASKFANQTKQAVQELDFSLIIDKLIASGVNRIGKI